MSDEVKKLSELLISQGKMCFLDPTTEEKITDFEKANGIELPEKYKEWLLFSDGGECFLPGGIQLYGIDHKPLINVDDEDRPDEDHIIIGSLASGDPIVFKKGEETVAVYNQDGGKIEDDEIFPDFFTFLKGLYDFLEIGG